MIHFSELIILCFRAANVQHRMERREIGLKGLSISSFEHSTIYNIMYQADHSLAVFLPHVMVSCLTQPACTLLAVNVGWGNFSMEKHLYLESW